VDTNKKPFSIANAIKPSKAKITLPDFTESEFINPPSYKKMEDLKDEIVCLKSQILTWQLRTENLSYANSVIQSKLNKLTVSK
tara:strand:+ start:529 stop:777 length:249 start_codon:yes stop_codon:yes gene_type:complete